MNKEKNIRAFIAIELTSSTQTALEKIQKKLKSSGADIKWVKPENIHITLKFLGNINQKKLSDISGVMDKLTGSLTGFSIEITHLGAFPKIDIPKVIWAGISKGQKEIINLGKTLEKELELLGFEKEKREFKAHITIGRMRSMLNRHHLIKELKEYKARNIVNQQIDKITLFKSTLSTQGPFYEVLHESCFKK